MEWIRERIRLAVPLIAAAYLGFFVYGLVMGVRPFEVGWMIAVAGVCVLVIVAYSVANRFGIYPVRPDRPLARSQRSARERRGW
jgi:hypothetical protein